MSKFFGNDVPSVPTL